MTAVVENLGVIGTGAGSCRGYEVTVVRDATSDYSDEAMNAALSVNLPHYASAIVGAEEIVASISAL